MTATPTPEIGTFVETCGYRTHLHDVGAGEAVMLLHGSGAGVSGFANWRFIMPVLAERFRVVVPDQVGFGYTETPGGYEFRFMESWVEQVIAILDRLGIEKTHIVGNSFGGAVTLHAASKHPDRFGRIVLMGAGGAKIVMPPELEVLWGYKPSVENMKKLLQVMAYDQSIVTDDLAEIRYRASTKPGVQEMFERIFPPPRQRWLDAQILPDEAMRALPHEVLILHGREDRIVPVAASQHMFSQIKRAQLHIFGECGHWTQIEHKQRFLRLVGDFFAGL